MIQFESDSSFAAKIKVVGVGGGGTNAVDSMVDSGLSNVDFYVINTDVQSLARSRVPTKIQIGREHTLGRGAGADPGVGAKAAVDAKEEITAALTGADMVFITAGLGGGTGTGAAPVVAEIAKSLNILTVAVVTRPFRFEGPQRMRRANEGLDRLREFVDTCIIVSNDRLLEVVGNKASLQQAFSVANNVLSMGVSSISELISTPGLINVDFADIRAIMNETGGAVMGVGNGKGENRATEAVKKACSSPLLDKIVIDGARGVLICVTGGHDMTLHEINEATTMVYEAASPDANIIFGAVIDEAMEDEIRVTIIATGFDDKLTRGGLDGGSARNDRDMLRPAGGGMLKDKLDNMFPGGGQQARGPVAQPQPNRPMPAPQPTPVNQALAGGGRAPQAAFGGGAQNTPFPGIQQAPARQPQVAAVAAPAAEQQHGGQGSGHDTQDFGNSGDGAFGGGNGRSAARPSDDSGSEDLETPAFLRRRKNPFE